MAERHPNTPVAASRFDDRRHGDRRRPAPPRPRLPRLRLAAVLVAAAIASSSLLAGSFAAGREADAVEARRVLVELASARLAAMTVTETAHLRLLEAVDATGAADLAAIETAVSRWRTDLAAVARRIPRATGSGTADAAAHQLRRLVAIGAAAPSTGDPVLTALMQLTPIENRLVEGAGQSGLDGADGIADRTTEHLYVIGVAADVGVVASSNRPGAAPALASFGVAMRMVGGAAGFGVLTAGPLSGWTGGPDAARRLTDLVQPMIADLGDQAPSAEYLATIRWSLAELGLMGTDGTAATQPGPPLTVAQSLDETQRLLEAITDRGATGTAARIGQLDRDLDRGRHTAAALLLAAGAVVGAAMLLLSLLVMSARRLQRQSEEDSLIDSLTGLSNRAGFAALLERLGARSGVWALLVDLDRFKSVNDTYGHVVGDAVLVAAGSRIAAAVEAVGGVATRLGGDEFAVLIADAESHDVDLAVAHLIEALSVIEVDERAIELGCSVGVVYGDPRVGVEQLLGEADLAMYRAKRSGGARSVHFDDASRSALARLRDGTIGASVQVGVRLQRSLADRSIVGALVHPSVLDATGASIDGPDLQLVAEFARRRFALLDATLEGIARSGRPIPPAGLRLWFEVAAADAVAFGGAEALWERLSRVGLSGTPLGVELIDAGTTDPTGLAAAVAAVRAHGVHVAVRGTGPGAIGLEALAHLTVDRLVVDGTMVEAVHRGDQLAARAVAAVADVGATLGTEVIGVGVPSLDVARTLVELGVAVAQVVVTEPWAQRSDGRRDGPVVIDL